jgi:hypothetical protein
LSQHSFSPEIGVHGTPIDNFSRSGSGDVNLSRLSVGLDRNERASSDWSSSTSIKFEVLAMLNKQLLLMLLFSAEYFFFLSYMVDLLKINCFGLCSMSN